MAALHAGPGGGGGPWSVGGCFPSGKWMPLSRLDEDDAGGPRSAGAMTAHLVSDLELTKEALAQRTAALEALRVSAAARADAAAADAAAAAAKEEELSAALATLREEHVDLSLRMKKATAEHARLTEDLATLSAPYVPPPQAAPRSPVLPGGGLFCVVSVGSRLRGALAC